MLSPCSVAVQPKAGCSTPSHGFVLPSRWGWLLLNHPFWAISVGGVFFWSTRGPLALQKVVFACQGI